MTYLDFKSDVLKYAKAKHTLECNVVTANLEKVKPVSAQLFKDNNKWEKLPSVVQELWIKTAMTELLAINCGSVKLDENPNWV